MLQHLGLQHESVSLLLRRVNDQAPRIVHTEEPHQLIQQVNHDIFAERRQMHADAR